MSDKTWNLFKPFFAGMFFMVLLAMILPSCGETPPHVEVTTVPDQKVTELYHHHSHGNTERLLRLVDKENGYVIYMWDAPGYGGGCSAVPLKK